MVLDLREWAENKIERRAKSTRTILTVRRPDDESPPSKREREQQVSDGSERPRRPASGADSKADRADRPESGDVADDEGFDEPYPEDEPDGDELGPDDFEDSDKKEQADKPEDEEKQHTDQDRWRRVASVAVISLIVGVGWALTLSTILLSRSGDRTAELISLFESGQEAREAGQEAREAALARLPESQAERRATIEGLQEQSQLFKAQELSAFAEQSESNANTARPWLTKPSPMPSAARRALRPWCSGR